MTLFDTVYIVLRTQALVMLGLQSIYNTLHQEREAKASQGQRKNLGVLVKDELSMMFREKGVSVAVMIALALALLMEIIGTVKIGNLYIFPLWVGSYSIVEGLLAFFTVETVYHILSASFHPRLIRGRLFGWTVHALAFTGCLAVSSAVFVSCVYSLSLCDSGLPAFGWFSLFAFWTILFISGLGGIGLINTVSTSVSSHVPRGKYSNRAYFALTLGILVGGLVLLSENLSLLGSATVYAVFGIIASLGVGGAYLAYSVVKRRTIQRTASIVYLFLMISLSGVYIANQSPQSPLRIISTSASSFSEALVSNSIPLIVFVVGYASLMLSMPRRLEQKVRNTTGLVLASVTFLMLFAVLAVYEEAAHSFGLSIFLVQSSLPGYPALLVGAGVFAVREARMSYKKRKTGETEMVPTCKSCGTRLQASSAYCWNCGGSSLALSKNEKVRFKGYAALIQKTTHHHSKRRRIMTLLLGGPVGYLYFGRNLALKRESEGPLVVTDRGVYYGREKAIDSSDIIGSKNGHYSDSVILMLKGKGDSGESDVELRTDDVEGFRDSLGQLKERDDSNPILIDA